FSVWLRRWLRRHPPKSRAIPNSGKRMMCHRFQPKKHPHIGLRITLILWPIATAPAEQKNRAPPRAVKIRRVGCGDLPGRGAYQPTVHHQGNRYIAYIGHHGGTPEVPKPLNPLTGKPESNGTSIVDVNDPAHPQYLAHIPGTPGNYEEGGTHRIFYSCN